MRRWPWLLGALAAAHGSVAAAQPQRDVDWPCFQRKVPEMSIAAVWSGPPVEDALARWDADPQVKELVARIAARRVPIGEATAAAVQFARTVPAADKAEKLTALFAGLFQTLNRERDSVMDGIDRYGRKQKGIAEQIRADASKLNELRANATDPKQVEDANNQLVWETRIFNERRASLSFVCEVPTLIEQRLFALGRAIGNELPKPN